MFLPTMHERYGFIYEITAIMLMIKNRKYFFSGIGLLLISCITYGQWLFSIEYSALFLSLINVLLYCWYVFQIRDCRSPK